MRIEYDPPSIQKEYENLSGNIKKYGKDFAIKLDMLINYIIAFDNAYDLFARPSLKMHMLHGELHGLYSLSPDNKKTKWRVLLVCLDENGREVKPENNEITFLKSIKWVRLRRVSEHYE